MEQGVEITERQEVLAFSTSKDILRQALKKPTNHSDVIIPSATAVPSGFHHFDQKTLGFKKRELTVIAVRPAMGKTAFLLSLVNNMAIKQRRQVVLFSTERPAGRVVQRLVETETGMSMNKIRDGQLSDSRKDHAETMISNISNAGIYINDVAHPSADLVIRHSKLLAETTRPDIIFVDSMEHLLPQISDPEKRVQECGTITESLHALAQELDVPVVLFARATSNSTAPCVEDLHGVVNERVQNVVMLHRPDKQEQPNGNHPNGYTQLIIQRDSHLQSTGKVAVKFIDSIDKFVNLSE